MVTILAFAVVLGILLTIGEFTVMRGAADEFDPADKEAVFFRMYSGNID